MIFAKQKREIDIAEYRRICCTRLLDHAAVEPPKGGGPLITTTGIGDEAASHLLVAGDMKSNFRAGAKF